MLFKESRAGYTEKLLEKIQGNQMIFTKTEIPHIQCDSKKEDRRKREQCERRKEMANYNCWIRTNYFRVTDKAALEELLKACMTDDKITLHETEENC